MRVPSHQRRLIPEQRKTVDPKKTRGTRESDAPDRPRLRPPIPDPRPLPPTPDPRPPTPDPRPPTPDPHPRPLPMRHRKKGRVLGRSPSHRLALFRNMASALFLTERDAELDDNEPKVKGRIVTTLQKAKELRPLVERCITIARAGLEAEDAARQFGTTATRNSEAWKNWRDSEDWKKWNRAIAPSVKARRRVVQMLGDKQRRRASCFPRSPRGSSAAPAATPASCTGQAAAGRRRHAGHPGIRRRPRSRLAENARPARRKQLIERRGFPSWAICGPARNPVGRLSRAARGAGHLSRGAQCRTIALPSRGAGRRLFHGARRLGRAVLRGRRRDDTAAHLVAEFAGIPWLG